MDSDRVARPVDTADVDRVERPLHGRLPAQCLRGTQSAGRARVRHRVVIIIKTEQTCLTALKSD